MKSFSSFFFRRILNMEEKLFIQYREVVFFKSVYFCQLFLFSNKWSRQRSEEKHFSSSRSGSESLSGHKFLSFYWHLSEHAIVTMAQWVGQKGSEAVGPCSNLNRIRCFFLISLTIVRFFNCSHDTGGRTTGFWGWGGRYAFESQPLPTIFILLIQRKVVIPLHWIKIFDTGVFLKPGRLTLPNFPVLWYKKLSTENRDTPSLFLSIKFLDTRKFLKRRRVRPRNVPMLWDGKLSTENRDTPLLHKIWNSELELTFVEDLRKLDSKH